ncbi:EF-hand domain-containing protein [Pycnococcus provasolii]
MVYKNRIRLKEFFTDFDILRCGFITPAQFKSGFSVAGLPMTFTELEALAEAYSEVSKVVGSLVLVDYRKFCMDIDLAFTTPFLEKTPTVDVPPEPLSLLDKERFLRSVKVTPEDDEIDAIIAYVSKVVKSKMILVKPFFDDACRNKNSECKVNHVTGAQFCQVVDAKLGLDLTNYEKKLLCEKFGQDGMVNYAAFARTVDPPPAF